METKKSIGIWIRVSTEDQAKGESPEHHEKRARMYAESRNWDIVTVYHLEAVSGKSVMQHSETKRMLDDLKKGNISGIVFSKLARLARNTRELLDFADIFREHNGDLISLAEAIDTSTPAGRLFFTIISAMCQWEREEIAERVAVSVPIRAKLGKSLGGQASYGFKWEKNKLLVNEEEAPVRQLIYTLFLKHKRKKTTADELNAMGYRTRNGSEFSDTTVHRLLRDPSAKGEHRANYTKSLGDKKNWKFKPETDWVINPCPAIVAPEVWNECNRVLDEQERTRTPKGRKPMHLLSGYVECTCGKKMYVFHDNKVFTCKTCKNRIASNDLDEIYHEQLKSFLFTETELKDYLKSSDDSIKQKVKLLEMQSNERDSVRKKVDSLINMRINKEISKESFMQQHKPFEERLTQMENMIPDLEAEIDFLKIQYLSSDTVLREAKDLYDKWLNLAFEEKRTIIETITDKIQVGKEDIDISLAYIPANFQKAGNSPHNLRDSLRQPT
jgi:site-specific DNA recombinase